MNLCHLLSTGLVAGALVAHAVPSLTGVTATPRKNGDIRVRYALSGEPAVVTFALYDRATGVKLDESLYNVVSGAVNRLVQPSGQARFQFANGTGRAATELDVRLRAWPTNCPPDYLVINLAQPNEAPAYYANTNAMPFAVTDAACKTTRLVMRKILAANVEFRMGAPGDAFKAKGLDASGKDQTGLAENLHWALLSEDYYLGIYPVTHDQHTAAQGSAYTGGHWKDETFKGIRQGDWPVDGVQYCVLRSYMHEDRCPGSSAATYTDYKYWPRDGHALNTNRTTKCGCTYYPGTFTPHLERWRTKYGFLFDLPTQAQWEFACRAGTLGPGYWPRAVAQYREALVTSAAGATNDCWYAELDDYAWNVNNSYDATVGEHVPHPVGLKKPNPFGLYDMLGNVAEFCRDICREAVGAGTEAELDPAGQTPKGALFARADLIAARGGSYCSVATACRPATYLGINPAAAENVYLTDSSAKDEKGAKWALGYRLWAPAVAVR